MSEEKVETNDVTVPPQTQATLYMSPCRVCGGTGLVYGLDGKPYLCPKCGGEGVPGVVSPYQPIWQQYFTISNGGVTTYSDEKKHSFFG